MQIVVGRMRCKRWASFDFASMRCNNFECCYYLQAQRSGHLRICSQRYLPLQTVRGYQLREQLGFWKPSSLYQDLQECKCRLSLAGRVKDLTQ